MLRLAFWLAVVCSFFFGSWYYDSIALFLTGLLLAIGATEEYRRS